MRHVNIGAKQCCLLLLCPYLHEPLPTRLAFFHSKGNVLREKHRRDYNIGHHSIKSAGASEGQFNHACRPPLAVKWACDKIYAKQVMVNSLQCIVPSCAVRFI